MRMLPLLALALMLPFSAHAQDYNTVLDVPDGATLITLSATERLEVDQDLLIATLSYEAENESASKLQDEINKVMAEALTEAKKVESVKVSTQSYQVYPYDYQPNPNPKAGEDTRIIRKWRGSQSLMLKGKTPDDLLNLAGKLQGAGLNITNLSYTVSPELLEDTQNAMLEDALKKLKTKAERTAQALDKTQSDLLQVNVDVGGYYPQPVMMARGAMMAKADMAMESAPVAAAGQSEITLTVTAQALIK